MIKVLSIGTDRKLFEEGSAVLSRSMDYASRMEELHIIVFALKKTGLKEIHKGNLHIYPTNSTTRWHYVFDGFKLSERIIQENGLSKNNSIVTTQDPFETSIVGEHIKKKFGLPLQIQIHTDFLDSHFGQSFLNKIRVIISKFTLRHADGIRVVSSIISDSIKHKFPKLKAKIDILPIFVDVELSDHVHPSVSENYLFKKNIFMASRLTKEKRFDVALKAFKKVIEKDTEVGLTICGTGQERNNIENLAKQLGLTNNIKIRGWENQIELISHYKLSDIFLLTSEFEGYGMTLIEAGASGCPIVTTEVGIAKTDLFKNGENAFVCPVGDVDCLSKSLIELLQNEEKRKLFKERMQASIKSTALSKEDYVSKYVALLEKLN